MVMEEILMLYYEINNIYLELYKMELNGCKNSDGFIELVDILKEKIDEEKNLYRELCEYIDDEDYDNLCHIDDVADTPFAKRIGDFIMI